MSITLVIGTALVTTPSVLADEPATREDVAALREEVRELKSVLLRVLEVEEARARGLSDILTAARKGSPQRPLEMTARRGAAAEPEPDKKAGPGTALGPETGNGSISGRVRVTGISGAPVAYVYLEDVQGRMAKGKTVEVRQKDKRFIPSVVAVQRGTRVVFPNQDNIFHNVFSLTPGSSFDLGTYRAGDKPGAYVFTQAGVVEVFCNLHSQMNAQVLVVPNAHFAKVGADGRFKLTGLPAGKHKVAAWTPNVAPSSRAIDVPASGDTSVDFELEGREDPPPHTDKNGMPYGSYK